MELRKQISEPQQEQEKYIAASLPVLKEQSSNIQRRKGVVDKEMSNSYNTWSTIQGQMDSLSVNTEGAVATPAGEHLQQPLLSVDISVIDERDDLLLSTSTIQSHMLLDDNQPFCPLHDKPQDIICMVDKIKICCYCALFGQHKDHTFKSEQQLASQIQKKLKQLKSLEDNFTKMNNSMASKKELRSLQKFCQNKKEEALGQVEQEYKEIISKLNEAKEQMTVKIRGEHEELIKRVRGEWEQCEIDVRDCNLFKEWEYCGAEILKKLKDMIATPHVVDYCEAYEDFPWTKGSTLIKEASQRLDDYTKRWKRQIEILNQGSNSLKTSLSSVLNLDIQSTISLQMENPTSIQEFHNINPLAKPPRYVQSCSEFSESKEKPKFRHSEFIESSLKPIRESIQFDSRDTRNSTSGLMNKRKSENYALNQWNVSTLMDRSRSNNRNDQTFLSPKLKNSGDLRSSRQSTSKPNPLSIVTQYEKNIAQNTLNLSKCGLDDQALIYFVQKAVMSHVPYEINLNRNTLTHNGLMKLLPLFLKVQTLNLAHTGLNDNCLDVFSKSKGPHRLQEINLLENGISLHRNRAKVDVLRKMGFKIIIQ